MHLSLWTIDSRELIHEWNTDDSVKIPIQVISSWQNMHQLAIERNQKIKWIKGQALSIFNEKCCEKMYLMLLVARDDEHRSLGDTILQIASHLIEMTADVHECTKVTDYRAAVTDCGWSLMLLLKTVTRQYSQLPWALLSATPQTVLAHLSPLMKTCLHESLPTSLTCLVSHDRQLASSSDWDLLPPIEQIALSLFLRSHAPISDCIIRLVSQPDKPLYRLVQIEMVPNVALLMLCGSQTSLDDIKSKVTQYWGPLMRELRAFQPKTLQYASLDNIPESLYAFFQQRSDDNQCTSGCMRLDTGHSPSVEESMKRLFLQFKNTHLSLPVKCIVIADKDQNLTFVVNNSDNYSRTLILVFEGQIEGVEARTMATEVNERINFWIESNRKQ